MFHGKLEFRDFDSPIDLVGGGVFLGRSSIIPVRHRLLRTLVLESPERVAIVTSERFAGDPEGLETLTPLPDGELQAELDELNDHVLDHAVLTIERRNRAVRYSASAVISIPVYLVASAEGVSLDWDYSRLLTGRATEIVWDVALAQIAGLPTYGPRTIVAGVHRATAGATLIAASGGIRTELPRPIIHDGPHSVVPDADVESKLFEAVMSLLSARPLERARTAVELSGGMDSALTSMAAAAVAGPGLMSVGAQFAGAVGEAQRERRRLLCDRGGFDDLVIPAERFPPFAAASLRRVPKGVWPEDENYPEMFEAIFGMLRSAGIDALISGFGGDELYLAYEGEAGLAADVGARPFPFLTARGVEIANRGRTAYPKAWLQESCWQSSASQAQRVLRYGLWPIYPYHSPALARFVSRLPHCYRRDRRLLRRTLTKVVGDSIFETDYVKESFEPVARRGISENRDYLIELVRRSPLALHPEIDRDGILGSLAGDIGSLDGDSFNALFRVLKIACFFQSDGTPHA